MLEDLSDPVSSSSMYSLLVKWTEVIKLRFQRDGAPLVFATVLESVEKALHIVLQRLPQVDETELNKDRSMMMRPGWLPAVTIFYRNRYLLLSAVEWVITKLGLRRTTSKETGTMYFPTKLMTRITGRTSLATKAFARSHDT